MHEIAAGSAGPVGLTGGLATPPDTVGEPPLSTETIGRGPSILGFAPLGPVPAPAAAHAAEEPFEGPVPSPVQMPELLPRRAPTATPPTADSAPAETPAASEPTPAERRRVVVRLAGDEELELGVFDEREAALACAREAVSRFARAETAGEWPEVDGRHLRPAAILSVDVQVAA